MTYPLPTFLPPEPGAAGLCEAYLHGRLIRADTPALLQEALLEALLGPLPGPVGPHRYSNPSGARGA